MPQISNPPYWGRILGTLANQLDLQAVLNLKAPIESPTFTGIPAAPTAAGGTNTTQVATTAFVRGEISSLVASAPSTLDTLNELATALGNDANFSTTVTNTLATKAPLASPTFTGTVTAPTIVGTDTTDSTSSTTGALKVAGGVGIAKKLNVGTEVRVATNFFLQPDSGYFSMGWQAYSGGWARGLQARTASGSTALATIGFYGSGDTLNYTFIGTVGETKAFKVYPSTGNVDVGGNLTVGNNNSETALTMKGTTAGSQSIDFMHASDYRWRVGAIGGGANPQFLVMRYVSGAYVDSPITISNSTGSISTTGDLTVSKASALVRVNGVGTGSTIALDADSNFASTTLSFCTGGDARFNLSVPTSASDVTFTSTTTGGRSAGFTFLNGSTTLLSISGAGNLTVGNNLIVTGNLTVNGTTTTVNSTTVTIDDPILTLGGDTAPSSDDNKDRGIEFRYHNGTAAKVGFFGYDDSASAFTFIPDATNTSEVFSGNRGAIIADTVTADTSLGIASGPTWTKDGNFWRTTAPVRIDGYTLLMISNSSSIQFGNTQDVKLQRTAAAELTLTGSLTMTGSLAMGSNRITGLGLATATTDAARYDQLLTTTMRHVNVYTASLAGVVTYNATGGTAGRGSITSAPSVVDGVTLTAGDKVLVSSMADSQGNGVFTVITPGTGTDGVWERKLEDYTVPTNGFLAFVQEGGASYKSRAFAVSTTGAGTIGGSSGDSLEVSQLVVQNASSATDATYATNVGVTDESTGTGYLTWVGYASGSRPVKVTSSKLSFNAGTGTLTATAFSGSGANLTSIPQSAVTSLATDLAARVAKAGDTLTGKLTGVTPTSDTASLRLPHGAAPSSPSDGDVWTTTDGMYVRVNGLTVGPLAAATGGASWGSITGTLTNQTDLSNALNGKASTSHTHAISDITNLQTTLDGKQAADADLTAIAGLTGTNGLLKKTAADTWSLDTTSYAPLESPSFTTPTLGVATATSLNKVTITAPAAGSTLTLANNGTLITDGANSLTLKTTANTVATFPDGTVTLAHTGITGLNSLNTAAVLQNINTSAGVSTVNISSAANTTGNTKTINIGPNSTTGTTNINLGSSVAGAPGTTTIYSPTLTIAGTTLTASNATSITLGAAGATVSLPGTTESTSTGTGAVQVAGGLGIAKNLNVGGDLTLTGNLVVNGTTSTVNSTTVSLDDPVITLGGDTAPTINDAKDRGVEFRYFTTAAKVGFFGYDDSSGKFTFLLDATNASETFSGTKGSIDAYISGSDINTGTVAEARIDTAIARKTDSADIEITDSSKGVILKSPDGTRYRLTVANDGSLTTTAL